MQRPTRVLLLIAYLAFISLGLPDGLLGVGWPSISGSLGVPLTALGGLLLATTVGFLLASTTSGWLLATIGVGRLLLLSSLVSAAGLAGYAWSGNWWLLLGAGVLLGTGGGAVDAGMNTYAVHHLSERHMNWLHACYGLGAMLGPLLMVAVLEQGWSWRLAYLLVGTLLLGLAVLFFSTRRLWAANASANGQTSDPDDSSRTTGLQPGELLRQPLVWLGIGLFFVYTGTEVSAGLWAYTLFTEGRGIPEALAGIWVSIYWGSLTVGRLVFGVLIERWSGRFILRLSMGLSMPGALLLWLNLLPLLSFLGLALLGFMLAPVFPVLMAQTPARLGSRLAQHAIGLQVAAANIAASLVPAFAGVLAGALGLEIIGLFLLFMAALLAGLHEATLLVERQRKAAIQRLSV